MIQDVQDRLQPLGVPVLLPEQRETPLAGRQPGQAGGLQAYLTAHPGGYVQLNDATGAFTSPSGHIDVGLLLIDVIHPTRAGAEALVQRVTRALHSVPAHLGPARLSIGAQYETHDMFCRATLTFQTSQRIPI